MQRTKGRLLLVAGVLAVAACSPGEDVSENTAVPTASTEPSDSSSEASTREHVRRPTRDHAALGHGRAIGEHLRTAGTRRPVRRADRQRRRGPHRHTRQRPAVLRPPQRPPGRQGLVATGGPRRLGRRDRAEHRRRPLRRAHDVQRHRGVSGERADRRAPQLRRRVRCRHQRLHELRRDRVRARRAQRRRFAGGGDEHPRPVAVARHVRPRAGRRGAGRDHRRVAQQHAERRRPAVRRGAGPVPRRHAVRGARPDRHGGVDQQRSPRRARRRSTTRGTGPTTRRWSSSATSTSTTWWPTSRIASATPRRARPRCRLAPTRPSRSRPNPALRSTATPTRPRSTSRSICRCRRSRATAPPGCGPASSTR